MTKISEHDLQKWLTDNPDLQATGVIVMQREEPARAKAYRTANLVVPTEAQEQRAIFDWAAWKAGEYPELAWLVHIPNGEKRDPVTAARLKGMGVKAGMPDIMLYWGNGKSVGLAIELKRSDRSNHPTPEQRKWLTVLESQGWQTAVCYGAQEAMAVIEEYLRGSHDN